MSGTSAREIVLPFRAARQLVEQQAAKLRPGSTESVPLEAATGRVLAEDVPADRDLPPFPRAARDGYALIASDFTQIPARLRIVGEVRAGTAPDFAVAPSQAAEIMTGAAVPAGANAVVMVEYTTRHGNEVEILQPVAAKANIVPAGAEARRGDVLLRPGTRLTPAAIAVAASVGLAQVNVFARPCVAILATGDELVGVGDRPGPAQVRNSNSYSLAAQVTSAGGVPVLLPIAPDEPRALRDLIEQGLGSDLLLLAGGVSAGKYDLVEPVLAELGAEPLFTGTLIQPGRPLLFGAIRRGSAPPTCFFGLPGNPVSTYVTFELFVRPVIAALSGAAAKPLAFVQVRLKREVRVRTGLTRFLPALLSGAFDQTEAELVPWQGSGDVVAAAKANCLLVVPPDREVIPAGEMVSVLLTG